MKKSATFLGMRGEVIDEITEQYKGLLDFRCNNCNKQFTIEVIESLELKKFFDSLESRSESNLNIFCPHCV